MAHFFRVTSDSLLIQPFDALLFEVPKVPVNEV
jgi:hypothetical protein